MGVELFDGFPVKPYQKRRTQTGDRAELRHLFVSTTVEQEVWSPRYGVDHGHQ
jgi:hypothetical protein